MSIRLNRFLDGAILVTTLLLIGFALAAPAFAESLTELQPPPAPIAGYTNPVCVASAFTRTGITGFCRWQAPSIHSTLVAQTNIVTWNAHGVDAEAGAWCARFTLNRLTGEPAPAGNGAAPCLPAWDGTGSRVWLGRLPLYYVTAGPTGHELLASGVRGYLFTP